MTTYLLSGGGTAGHVNPLLAIADRIRRDEPDASIIVLGTEEGLESRLVPQRGYELVTVPKLPFPRRPGAAALRFPGAFRRTVSTIVELIRSRGVDVVVGVGGYVAAPSYLAARRARVPLALHEANARPGMANRLGSRFTRFVGVAFEGTPLRHARMVGMPLREEIERLDREASRPEGWEMFGLDPQRPTLLVTGGSLGARRINEAVAAAAGSVIAAGWQLLHITGDRAPVDSVGEHHVVLRYCDRMDLALSVADAAVARAGAATVSELTALGIPAVYVPLAIGNGEQRLNARSAVAAGAALMVDDAALDPQWVSGPLVRLLGDGERLASMGEAALSIGVRDGTARMVALVREAAGLRLSR